MDHANTDSYVVLTKIKGYVFLGTMLANALKFARPSKYATPLAHQQHSGLENPIL